MSPSTSTRSSAVEAAPAGPDHVSSRLREAHDIHKKRGTQYQNNLLWQVGFLELTNALDFPANVWNQIPTPLFAAVLMGIGGSIAILWSIFAFWDMHKSIQNIRLLREERRFLKSWQRSFDDEDNLDRRCLVQAWLDVNFRELGWEMIDRVLLDLCCGISGILVGTGALMAIRGDIDTVFQASNLLSGYIGNSFLAPFALVNSFWAVFMWIRAGGERKYLTKGDCLADEELQSKMRHHGNKHRLYAAVNGTTAVAGCIGSIVSSTLWYGYVVIAPCVFTSVYCNWLWRKRMGYDRTIANGKEDLSFDILRRLQAIQMTIDAAETGSVGDMACFTREKPVRENILRHLEETGLFDAFCCRLQAARATEDRGASRHCQSVVADADCIANSEMEELVQIAQATIVDEHHHILEHRERFLIELYGRYFRALECFSLVEKSPG